jgi:glycine betaine/proline transport system permease protein
MAGLNQTLMLSLSMVVIVAIIAGGGLGQVILRGVNRADVPIATTSGLAVLILAVVLDRITQASRGRHGVGRGWLRNRLRGKVSSI